MTHRYFTSHGVSLKPVFKKVEPEEPVKTLPSQSWSSGKMLASQGKDVAYCTCPNPKCLRRSTFVKNTGYKVNEEEWCSKRCFEEYIPLTPKEVK